MKYIDNWLNKITMYRLVLYFLITLLVFAAGMGAVGKIPFSSLQIALSSLWLAGVSWIVNIIFSRVFEVPVNTESAYITALILALIVSPARSVHDYVFLTWAAILAMATKYILAINGKHIFNPAAIAVVLTAYGMGQSASWWVGNLTMLPVVVIGGWLIARKIQREDMVWYFLAAATVAIAGFTMLKGNIPIAVMNEVLLHSSLWFFAFVMLTEPLTAPPTKKLQIWYAIIVGVLFAPQVHAGPVYSTPELALVVGNVFAYIVSPKIKLVLRLAEKIQTAPDTYDFVFPLAKKIDFAPGQYMEWTLAHAKTDDRGNRRYFTMASSPTETNVRIGVKFYDPASSFKKMMLALNEKTPIAVAQLAGDFVMPSDTSKKLVFIAGGVGITPFRSMIKYLIDTKQKRNVVLMYSNKRAEEIVYKDVFDNAEKALGMRVIYVNTEADGRIDRTRVETEIPDFRERTFYLSGPHGMVNTFEQTLKAMEIPAKQVVKDYFPGYV